MDKIVEKCEDYFDNWLNCSSFFFFMFVLMLVLYVVFNGVGCDCLDIFVDSLVNVFVNFIVC